MSEQSAEAPSYMKEPCTCQLCGEWVELQESGKCDQCEKWCCNSCTYESMGVYYCEECWEHRK